MKKNLLLFLLLTAVMSSCSSDTDSENTPAPGEGTVVEEPVVVSEGKQIFRVNYKETTGKVNSLDKTKKLEPAFALISIVDASENQVYSREKFTLTNIDGNYETGEIVLEAGSYKLTEFIVVDANNIVISLAPKEGSALALFAQTTLPFEFMVSKNQTNTSDTENIIAAGYTAFDFGYGELNLVFPVNTDFFSLIVDDSIELTEKNLKLESVTGSVYLVDWGDGTIEEYVSSVSNSGLENTISHTYLENGEYSITVSGAVEAIELLNFASNQDSNWKTHVSSVDIGKLVHLKSCSLYSGNLTSIDISNNIALESLELGYNQISTLDVSNNPNLKNLFARYNQLTTVDLTNNINLEYISLFRNQLTSLDVSNNTKLIGISLMVNQLTNFDVTNNIALAYLDLSSNLLTNIDVTNNVNMVNLNVGDNNLSSIDISKNVNLIRVDLYQNQIESIDLSSNPILENLYINDNLLSDIDLSSSPNLERLIIQNNNFSGLDLTSAPKIFDLEIGGNQFDALTLDAIISHIHGQATTNSITNGYMDYKNNPGSESISNVSMVKINELITSYNWFFNNN